jgi:peptide/nickel transport system permease protein
MGKKVLDDGRMVTIAHSLVEMWRVFRKNRAALFGLFLFIVAIVLTMVAPHFYEVDPLAMAGAPATPPGRDAFILGTDYIGRDVFAEIIHGGKGTLAVGVVAALTTIVLGTLVGAMAGFYGGRVDTCLMRFVEFFQVMPAILLAGGCEADARRISPDQK